MTLNIGQIVLNAKSVKWTTLINNTIPQVHKIVNHPNLMKMQDYW